MVLEIMFSQYLSELMPDQNTLEFQQQLRNLYFLKLMLNSETILLITFQLGARHGDQEEAGKQDTAEHQGQAGSGEEVPERDR
jgi:hypothetical protein